MSLSRFPSAAASGSRAYWTHIDLGRSPTDAAASPASAQTSASCTNVPHGCSPGAATAINRSLRRVWPPASVEPVANASTSSSAGPRSGNFQIPPLRCSACRTKGVNALLQTPNTAAVPRAPRLSMPCASIRNSERNPGMWSLMNARSPGCLVSPHSCSRRGRKDPGHPCPPSQAAKAIRHCPKPGSLLRDGEVPHPPVVDLRGAPANGGGDRAVSGLELLALLCCATCRRPA